MVRSLAWIGFSYLIALVASVYFGTKVAIGLSMVFLCLFVVSLFFRGCRRRKVVPIAMLAMSVASMSYSIKYTNTVVPIEKLDGVTANISGVICDTPYKAYNKYYYMIETDSIDFEGAPQNMKIRLSSNTSLDAEVYDRVSAQVKLFEPSSGNGFSSKTYYASKNIHMFAYLSDYDSIKIEETSQKPINYYILKLREELMTRIKLLLGNDEESIATGMLLGYKFDISEDVRTDFNHAGISHLLAVSGYHVSTVASFIFILLNFFRLPKKLSNVLAMLGVISFMAITGFSSSVMRAGIMYIIYLFGQLISRKSDSLNSLGIASLMVCILNPFSAGDIGLLLSVSATLGIIVFSPILSTWFKEKTSKVKSGEKFLTLITDIVAVTLSANIFTMPITMLTFKCVYPISLIANILLIFVFSAMMFCLILAITLSYIGFLNILVTPFSFAATLLIKYMVSCASVLGNLPFAYISADFRFLLLWLSGTMILLAVTIALRRDLNLFRVTAILSSIMLMVGILSYQIIGKKITTVAVLKSGTGVSAVVSKDGHASVISCGGDSFYADNIQEYLESINIRKIDSIFVSSDSSKTSGFIESLLESYSPSSLIVQDKVFNSKEELFRNKVSSRGGLTTFSKSIDTSIWGNVYVSAINVSGESFICLKVNDVKFLLCPAGGDAYSLPSDWKASAFAVYGDVPDNSEMVTSRYVMLSTDEKDLSKNIRRLVKEDRKILTTCDNDKILIDCIQGNEITIHR